MDLARRPITAPASSASSGSMLTPRRSAILDALRGGGAVVLLVEAFADDRLPNRLAAGNGAGGHDQPLG